MKKLIILLMCMMTSSGILRAEDALQVVPFETKANATIDDALSFSISMNNTSAEIWALQFDILLPDGMTIDDVSGYEPFELSQDRFPHTVGRGGAITWNHSVMYDLLESGWYRVVVFTSEADRIIGDTGELFKVYYLTDETMQPGLHPIYIKDAVLTITGSTDIKLGESTSYCLIGESPLKTADEIVLDEFTGYIPSWVVESMNEDLANNNAACVRLENADGLGATIETANKNCLYYVKAGSMSAEQLTGKNVVTTDGVEYSCENLYLYDGDYSFCNPQEMTGGKASFNRTFVEEYWSTVCLPFAVSAEQVAALKEGGVMIEALTRFDGETLTFSEVESMSANTPYIVKCSSEMSPFAELDINSISSSENMNDMELDGVKMKGSYETVTLNSDATASYYVFNAASGEFVKVGKNATVMPFRAYIQIDVAAPAAIRIQHSADETAIDAVENGDVELTDVYTVSGHVVKKNVDASKALQGLEKGIYIINNQKTIIK